MKCHERMVLEERIRPAPVAGDRLRGDAGERIGGRGRDEHEEERQHREQHRERDRREAGERTRAAQGHVHDGAREDERPEEDRAGERGPERDRAVEERRRAGVVLGDVHEAEVVREERADHREVGDQDEQERTDRHGPGAGERPRVALPAGVGRGAEPPEGQPERGAERACADIAPAQLDRADHGAGVWCEGTADPVGAV